MPSDSDFIFVFLYDRFRHSQSGGRQPFAFRQRDGWFDPELGFTFRALDMNVDTWLLAGEEEKTKSSLSENRRAH
jgi:hypothetical protein